MSNGIHNFHHFVCDFSIDAFSTDRCVTTRLPADGVRHVCSSFSVQLRNKSFVIIPNSSLVQTHVFGLTSLKTVFI